MNDGVFPKIHKQEGYLNDNDRMVLESKGIELAKTAEDSMYESNFNMYRTLTIPEEKLFLSYCSSDKEGQSIRPSIMIKKIKRMFPKLTQKSDVVKKEYVISNEKATFEEALQVYYEYLEGAEVDEEWKNILIYFYNKNKDEFLRALSGAFYTNKSENLNKDNLQKLYGKSALRTTISRLENYRKCPFSFHMTYGLKLKENDNFAMNSLDTGSFMHEVIDKFFEEVQDVKTISEEEILEIVNKIIDEILQTSRYYIFRSSAKFRRMTRRLKKVVLQSMKYIVQTLKNSDFEVAGHELEFGPEKIDENVEIVGKIDRIDVGKLNDKEYVRIIDYKSRITNFDLNKVVSGLQIQLITYLDAVTEQKNMEQAGALYLGLIDKIVKSTRNLSDKEIENQIRKSFKMQGLILADVNVVKMMDKTLERGHSLVVPAFIGKEGELKPSFSSIATKEEFEELQEKVKSVIKDISKEITSGNIDIKPYKYKDELGCTYCKYRSICMFDPNMRDNDYNIIPVEK